MQEVTELPFHRCCFEQQLISGRKCLAAVGQDRDGVGLRVKGLSQFLGFIDNPLLRMEKYAKYALNMFFHLLCVC